MSGVHWREGIGDCYVGDVGLAGLGPVIWEIRVVSFVCLSNILFCGSPHGPERQWHVLKLVVLCIRCVERKNGSFSVRMYRIRQYILFLMLRAHLGVHY